MADSELYAELAERYGTPFYCYDRDMIAERIAGVRAAFAGYPTRLLYSVKANSNLSLLRWLDGEGLGFDIVSGGELDRLTAAGVDPRKVVFSGVGKTETELESALASNLWLVNLESAGETERLVSLARERAGGPIQVSLRLNPDVDAGTHRHITTGRIVNKFGLDRDACSRALDLIAADELLTLQALHMHLGSQIRSVAPFVAGLERLLETLAVVREQGFAPRWLNIGGGFGISQGQATAPEMADYAAALLPLLDGAGVELILEPGRYLVEESGRLLTRVVDVKSHGGRVFAVVDAGMNDLLRPALYGSDHPIVPVSPRQGTPRPVTVVGPICETADTFAPEALLVGPERGDLLAITHCGAYGFVMASRYNSRPLPPEIWLTAPGQYELIRRRESPADAMAAEIDCRDSGDTTEE